jgi:uncharacterized glyoxalase superfamily protein PhnB
VAVSFVPKDMQQVVPYLAVQGAAKVLAFVQEVFGAKVLTKHEGPGGRLAHAEVRIGDCVVMMGDPEDKAANYNGMLMVYVPDVDAAFQRAVRAGAKVERELADQFYGDRTGGVIDMCGNHWYIGTHKEDVSPQEMERRIAEYAKKQGG